MKEPIYRNDEYKGQSFMGNLRPGDTFVYVTTERKTGDERAFHMYKTMETVKSCRACPIRKYRCEGLACCAMVVKEKR